jgi:hypothetical protein
MEKCQNKANLLAVSVVLIISPLWLRANEGGSDPEKQSQFPAGGMGPG